MRVEIHREGRELVQEFTPKPGEKAAIDSYLSQYRRENAELQEQVLARVRIGTFVEILGEYIEIGEGLISAKLRKEYENHNIDIYIVRETGSMIWLIDHKEADGRRIIDGMVITNRGKAIDLAKMARDWGVKKIVLGEPKETTETEGVRVATLGGYYRNDNKIVLWGFHSADILAHEAGHHWQQRGVMLSMKKELGDFSDFWGKSVPLNLARVMTLGIENNLVKGMRKEATEAAAYKYLLEANIDERNADAFAAALVRRCRELGVPIVNDKDYLEFLRARRWARKKVDSYVEKMIKKAKQQYE